MNYTKDFDSLPGNPIEDQILVVNTAANAHPSKARHNWKALWHSKNTSAALAQFRDKDLGTPRIVGGNVIADLFDVGFCGSGK
jgi:dihydrofolate reductase